MNPILDLVKKFKSNQIERYVYIDKMHQYNKSLYYLSKHLPNTDIQKIEIIDNEILFTTRRDNLILTFNGVDRRAVPLDIINFNEYEIDERFFVDKLIKTGKNVLDVGANIGWYTLAIAKNNKNIVVHSFEPIPDTFEYLRKNTNINEVKNVKLYNIGLSNRNGKAEFFYFPEGSVLASEKNVISCNKALKTPVELMTLDKFTEENNLNDISLIKIDVEGAELSVLEEGVQTIKNNSPALMIEMFDRWTKQFNYHPNNIISLLDNLNYSCYLPINKVLIPFDSWKKEPDEERLNFIFLHRKNHRNFIENYSY